MISEYPSLIMIYHYIWDCDAYLAYVFVEKINSIVELESLFTFTVQWETENKHIQHSNSNQFIAMHAYFSYSQFLVDSLVMYAYLHSIFSGQSTVMYIYLLSIFGGQFIVMYIYLLSIFSGQFIVMHTYLLSIFGG